MQLGGGYIFEGDDEALERDLEAWWDRIQFGVHFNGDSIGICTGLWP